MNSNLSVFKTLFLNSCHLRLYPLSFPSPSFYSPLLSAPGDYQNIFQTLTFSSFNTSHKVIMRIVDDYFVEHEEEFLALLIATDGLILSQLPARIVIIDDEGVFVFAYMHFISSVIYFFIFHFCIIISVPPNTSLDSHFQNW